MNSCVALIYVIYFVSLKLAQHWPCIAFCPHVKMEFYLFTWAQCFGNILHVFGDLFIYLYPMFLDIFSMFWRLIYVLVPHVFGDVLHVFGYLFIYLYPMFLGMFSMFLEIYLYTCTPCFWGCSPCFWIFLYILVPHVFGDVLHVFLRFIWLIVPHVFGDVLHVFGDCSQFKLFGHPGLVICGDSKMSAILALIIIVFHTAQWW
jgi:hypothetical protein